LREFRQDSAARHRRTLPTVRCPMMGRRRRARRIGRLVLTRGGGRAAEEGRAEPPCCPRSRH